MTDTAWEAAAPASEEPVVAAAMAEAGEAAGTAEQIAATGPEITVETKAESDPTDPDDNIVPF
jgi:hypothetical protein